MRLVSALVFVVVCGNHRGAARCGAAKSTIQPARSRQIDKYLQHLDRVGSSSDTVRVIVTTRKGASDKVKSDLAGSDDQVREHKSIDALSATVPVGTLRAIAERDDVISVSVDAPVHAGADSLGTLADNALLGTLGLKDKTDAGHDVVVAVLDSGIVNHAQIPVTAFYDFVNSSGDKVKQLRRLRTRNATSRA
jgi:hypothetical protein